MDAGPSAVARAAASDVDSDGFALVTSGYPLEPGGRFRLPHSSYWVFTVPTRRTVSGSLGDPGARIEDVASGATMTLDRYTGREVRRWNPEGIPAEVNLLFDEIADSVAYERPKTPFAMVIGGNPGEIILEWSRPSGLRVSHWQYRRMERVRAVSSGSEWSDWADIPGRSTTYRVRGLADGAVFHAFQLRPWTQDGPGVAYVAVGPLPQATSGGVVYASWGRLEGERAFALAPEIVFDVPSELHLFVASGADHPALDRYNSTDRHGLEATVMLDLETGSSLVVFAPTGEFLDRHITSAGERLGVGALFNQIVESIRRSP